MSDNVTTPEVEQKPRRILRWPEVRQRTGINQTAWSRGIREGVYPAGFKLGPPPTRAVGWLESDIDALILKLANGEL